ncbi:hypothetical protein KIMH_00320 [Bombiscardovia apis]|uniref:ABC transmembrane type-2 domain-containing protein n=1 Tax=Bombiscardovia apis TaxID=2932182 RepID=A0ABN6SCV7_9BIFI|nr:ABC transporter permease [Bombiscardovia apis]BDR53921.1 hypothetical protein KIMH_00320 [Bombiscardovia apis]
MKALIVKEFRELLRDKRTLAMLIAMPVLLLFIFGYAANFSVDRVKVAVIGEQAQSYQERIDKLQAVKEGVTIVSTNPARSGQNDAEQIFRDRKADAVISVKSDAKSSDQLADQADIYIDGSGLFAAQSAKRVFLQMNAEDVQAGMKETRTKAETAQKTAMQTQQQSMQNYLKQMQEYQVQAQAAAQQGQPAPPAPQMPQVSQPQRSGNSDPTTASVSAKTDNTKVLFNPELKTSFIMIPGLIGLIMTLIGTMITSIGLVREREQGTLEQLAVMPIRPGAVIMGKIAPYFLLALFDMAVITGLGMWVFGLPFNGDFWPFLLGTVIFLFVVLGLGIFISTVSQNSGQAVQLAMMLVMPQMLLSGMIFPLESMASVIRWIGYLLPLTWFNELTQGTMLRGASWGSTWMPLLILAAEAVIIFSASTLKLRNLLTHGGGR